MFSVLQYTTSEPADDSEATSQAGQPASSPASAAAFDARSALCDNEQSGISCLPASGSTDTDVTDKCIEVKDVKLLLTA